MPLVASSRKTERMNDEPHGQIREMRAAIREKQPAATDEARAAAGWAEAVWENPWIAFAVIAILPGFVLSLLGPFGSFSAPAWMRFAYWMPTMAIAACIGAAISIWSERSPVFDRRPVLRVAVVTTLMTAAMSGAAYGWGVLVFGPGRMTYSPTFVFYVATITIVVVAISAILRARRTTIAAAPLPAPAAAGPSPLAARLPPKLKDAAILALQGEDHYVRIHTDKGSDLILMRLADAIDAMGTTPGARTHRSWWVAKSAVQSVRRDNGRTALVLTNTTEAPVSRGYAPELREAGWL